MKIILFLIFSLLAPFSSDSQTKRSKIFEGDSLLISRLYKKEFKQYICEKATTIFKDKDIASYKKIELLHAHSLNRVNGFSLYYNDTFYISVELKDELRYYRDKPKEWHLKQLFNGKIAIMNIPLHLLESD